MLIANLAMFVAALFVLVKSAEHAVNHSSRIARVFRISEFVVSFFIISVISVFPEATISIVSALQGVPEFGLGTLIGSNVADLLLVFGIAAVFSRKGIAVKSEILQNDFLYLVLLLIPLIVGYDGHLSRVDGILLVFGGLLFFLTISIESKLFRKQFNGAKAHSAAHHALLLFISLLFLIGSAYFTVEYGVKLANDMGVPPVLVAITIVAIGTCLPELIFSLKAVNSKHDELALGDILGTVITDATIIVGIIALIKPFSFDPVIIYSTGIMMFLAAVLVTYFMKSDKMLTKKEGIILLLCYVLALIVEFLVSKVY